MRREVEPLPVGWRPGAFASAGCCAGVLLLSAIAIHVGGLAVGAAVLLAGLLLAGAAWCEAGIDGPSLRVRGLHTLGRCVTAHARSIDRLEYRRGLLLPRLSLRTRGERRVVRVTGPTPRAECFRQLAMWLIVHGRRQARIDPVLLDALAAMPDHARTGQPHDASHA